MEKIIKQLFVITFLLFLSCNRGDEKNFVECKDEILYDSVYKSSLDRGTMTLKGKNTYTFYGSCNLIYRDFFPNWIQDHNKPDYSFNKYVFRPSISDIDVPYIIFKKKNKCYFYIVKNRDTLAFKLTDYP